MMRRLIALTTSSALLAGVLAGCGSTATASHHPGGTPAGTRAPAPAASTQPSQPSPPAGSRSPATTAVITIHGFAYTVPATVSAGARVTVHNRDDVAHTITADTGHAFDVTVPASGTATFTAPTTAGRYPFHCTYHANMHATLTVS